MCHSSAGVMMHVFQPGFCAQVMCPTKRGVASGWSQTARARRVRNRAGVLLAFHGFHVLFTGFSIYFAVPARRVAGKSSLRPVLTDTLFA